MTQSRKSYFDSIGLDDWQLAIAYSLETDKEQFIKDFREFAAFEQADYSVDKWIEWYNTLTPESLAKALDWQNENCPDETH